MKATEVILRDHRAAEELFDEFKNTEGDENKLLETMIFDTLTVHERMEDKHFYPAVRDLLTDSSILTDLEVEQKKLEVEVLAARALPGNKRNRILSIIDTVLQHAKREEAELLPQVESGMDAIALEKLGKEMQSDSATANKAK